MTTTTILRAAVLAASLSSVLNAQPARADEGAARTTASREPAARRPMGAYQSRLAELAEANTDFRRVIHTGARTQLVLMSLPPGGEIGSEAHAHVEQLIFVQGGRARAVLGDATRTLGPGDVLVVPPGLRHNVVNPSTDAPLKLYTVYAPPNHIGGRVHSTRAAAEADRADEAFGARVR